MIDLHCHLLPGIDDGPATLADALALAQKSADQGITAIACTPHIMAGVYDNDGRTIRSAIALMQTALDRVGIDIRLVVGADLHVAPDNLARLKAGTALALNDSRYVLLELPHHVLPPRVEHAVFNMMSAGYVPVLTHPERMSWIERDYALVQKLAHAGVVMQITAGALTGAFGRRARHWSERMLDENLVDLVATDAHGPVNRPPLQAEAYERVCERVGLDRARRIFFDVPEAILADRALPDAPAVENPGGLFMREAGLFSRARALFARSRAASHSDHV